MATPRKPGASNSGNLEVKVRIEPGGDAPVFYVNHVESTFTPHEFNLIGARVPGMLSAEERDRIQKTGELTLSPEFSVILPPTLLPKLIELLQERREKFEAANGPIRTEDPQ